MPVSIEETKRIADLARLRFSDDELSRMATEMEKILDYVQKLQEVDTSDVEPLTHVHDQPQAQPKNGGLRKDIPDRHISRHEALSNGPDTDGEFFVVPKVIE